jgi:hypothetical protein
MKESISEHEYNIKMIKKAIEFDKQWFDDRIAKRYKELEFYQRQVVQARARKMDKFDRNTFLMGG